MSTTKASAGRACARISRTRERTEGILAGKNALAQVIRGDYRGPQLSPAPTPVLLRGSWGAHSLRSSRCQSISDYTCAAGRLAVTSQVTAVTEVSQSLTTESTVRLMRQPEEWIARLASRDGPTTCTPLRPSRPPNSGCVGSDPGRGTGLPPGASSPRARFSRGSLICGPVTSRPAGWPKTREKDSHPTGTGVPRRRRGLPSSDRDHRVVHGQQPPGAGRAVPGSLRPPAVRSQTEPPVARACHWRGGDPSHPSRNREKTRL